jgi:hypothetical protein
LKIILESSNVLFNLPPANIIAAQQRKKDWLVGCHLALDRPHRNKPKPGPPQMTLPLMIGDYPSDGDGVSFTTSTTATTVPFPSPLVSPFFAS